LADDTFTFGLDTVETEKKQSPTRFQGLIDGTNEDEQINSPPPKHNYLPWDPDFPHQWQEFSDGCGAAAFAIVYEALGHPASQKDIYKAVAVPDIAAGKGFTCLVSLLNLDAILRGFHSLHVQVINPIEMLKHCYEHNIEAVVHQRAAPSSVVGHATVLIGISDEIVYMHCPANGPRQVYSHNDVLERMAPFRVSDIGMGNALTLISNPLTEKHTCKECNKEIPECIPCQNCGKAIRLSPASPLGCIDPECSDHKWVDIFCPMCFRGIRQTEDTNENEISPEDWPQVLKERQEECEKKKNRYNFGKVFTLPDNQPDKQPIKKWLK
jgi:hypothetical protein